MDVNNKIAIVTGGLGGIGFATVESLLQNGINFVAIFDIYKIEDEIVHQKLEELQNKYNNDRYGYYPCDVNNVPEFTNCYDRVLAHKSYVDILINNAGVLSDKNIDLTIDVNLRAVVHGTMIAIERMGKCKNKDGVIVNVASNLGLNNITLWPVYCATKHAVVSFVRSMKEHNKSLGVRIVSLCPGATNTHLVRPDNLRNSIFEFINSDEIDKYQPQWNFQSPNSAASAIIEIIKRGKEGDVWLAHNDEPPFNVGEENNLENLRIPF